MNGRFAEICVGLSYLATAAVVVAYNREPLRELYHDLRRWYRALPQPPRAISLPGKLGADIREAIDAANEGANDGRDS